MNLRRWIGHSRRVRLAVFSLLVALGAALLACSSAPTAPPGSVHVLTAKGAVNPVMERYIGRGIEAAEKQQASALVIRLNTPGGLSSSMDKIDQRILASRIPIIVYVWPSGGQAASAGTFITYAAHVAAMAPGTVIGSATPIDASGGDIQGDLRNKVLENAVAKIRSYANLRDRNADWAESAVRQGLSVDQDEALRLKVVDLVAPDLDSLLRSANGRSVTLEQGRTATLNIAGTNVVFNDRNLFEKFLDILADPNIAFLLISLGSLAIFIEIVNPGQIFPGVFGLIALILGFLALSVLPFSWAGVALILFAFVLFGLELFVASHGILGIGGIVSLVLGGLILTSDNPPEFQVSRWLIFGLAAALGLFVLFVIVNIVRIRRMPAQTGVQTLVGREAVARSSLDPAGMVFLEGEYWSAESENGAIEPGERVLVTEIHGLKLKVKKQEQPQGG